jgi:CubicO group peptidase (beta-lactamase class C family)
LDINSGFFGVSQGKFLITTGLAIFCLFSCSKTYFPPPDALGGWRTATAENEIRQIAGMEKSRLDQAFEFIKGSTKNGGLLVVRHGWLVYERYFGKGHREATPNLASCGKSFTSIAVGILISEHPELFSDGLDQKIFTPDYLPAEAFPLSDPAKAEIKLGQLLAFSAGIRGNNPAYVYGQETIIEPSGPDGWFALVDSIALGQEDFQDSRGRPYSAKALWCEPGLGYSYATAAIHIASIMVRQITGMELMQYVQNKLARPLGWGRWGYGYQHASRVTHTPGGGGIALRATDMLRFCYMLLHDGRWHAQQIVPAEFIRHCRNKSPYNPHYPYSLQFNVNGDGGIPELPRDAFWKRGSGGHCFYVVPALDLVVWKLGGRDFQYDPQNTGLPILSETLQHAETREDWTATVDQNLASIQTLQMVIDAIVE